MALVPCDISLTIAAAASPDAAGAIRSGGGPFNLLSCPLYPFFQVRELDKPLASVEYGIPAWDFPFLHQPTHFARQAGITISLAWVVIVFVHIQGFPYLGLPARLVRFALLVLYS